MYSEYSVEEVDRVGKKIQDAIKNLVVYSNMWQLKISEQKTLHLGKRNSRRKYFLSENIAIADVKDIKDLGAQIDESLQFGSHYDKITAAAKCAVFRILRIFKSEDVNILIRMSKVYVRPILEYNSPVWNPYKKKHIVLLESIQRTYTRLIFYRCFPRHKQMNNLPSYEKRLDTLKLDSLYIRRKLIDICFLHKMVNGQTAAQHEELV
ncbi:hypothetical protein ANCCEY_12736 [Ancylostoma ceylanicum]|uniref:Uncharacterized protein n=1 Tax=Ancylostoma ceylanicum TaxID=53326 RepID=A0A0D6L8K1_9BILA|nr:hypothetical protein ANCCEY_12736 [Ancylostoma ceylanicum]